jgi:hypothetical protein
MDGIVVWILWFWREKYPRKELQRQSGEQRLKDWLSRDYPTWCSIPYTITKTRHHCGCQQELADTWKGPDIAVSWEALSVSDKYIGRHLQPVIERSAGSQIGSPIEELEKDWQGWRGLQPHRKNNNINQPDPPKSSQTLNHQPNCTYGGSCGSSCMCSRGWPCWTSMGGDAFGPVKAPCPSVGECQGG